MKINTRIFGEVDIAEEKILTFDRGIIGFPDMKHFTLIHDVEKGDSAGIRFLQSIEEPDFAMPVMNPLIVCPDYNPLVEEELLNGIGEIDEESMYVLVTVSVPADLEKMSVNLQGPIVINAKERKACQIIVDPEKYPVKFSIYDILQAGKEDK